MISTKGRYAIRVLVDIAEQGTSDYVPLRDIATRQDISQKYLEAIMRGLVKGGFLTGMSGKGGGYRLSRTPDKIVVGEVLTWMEGTLATVACLSEDALPCPRADYCSTLPMWREYDAMVHDFFYSKTIADLMQK